MPRLDDLGRNFARYVSLNIMGMMGLSCYILADTFFVARGVGATGLAALNLAIPVYSFIHGIGLMIGVGGATRFTVSGSKQVFTQAVYYSAAAGIILLLVGLLWARPLAVLLGGDADTLQNTTVYLQTVLVFAPAFLTNNLLLAFVRNDGAPRRAMAGMLLGSLSNILLDYLFVFPLGMGMFGAALATGLAPLVSLAVLSPHFLRRGGSRLRLCRQRPRLAAMVDISSLGASALIAEVSSGVVIVVFNMLLLRLEGSVGVAAYGVVANIALVVMAMFTGVSQGMQPLLSGCYGTGDRAGLRRVLRWGLLTAAAIALVVYLVATLLAGPIVAVFNRDADPRLADIATRGLRLYFLAFAPAGANLLTAAYFSAVDRPRQALAVSGLRGFVVILPMAFALTALLGLDGVWLAMTATELLVLLVSVALLRRAGKHCC